MNGDDPALTDTPNPLALDPHALGRLVQHRREVFDFGLVDAADLFGMSSNTLSRLEIGQPVGTDLLFQALNALGLAMLILPKQDASIALHALGHTVNWHRASAREEASSERKTEAPPAPIPTPNNTPTLFLDYDGTLHVGHAFLDTETGDVSLDSGRPLVEFAPLLSDLLAPYPEVEIVLTTSWLQKLTLEQVLSYLPPELARRVVGTTLGIKPRLGHVLDGTEKTYVITSYAYSKQLRCWLAVDDRVYGADCFGRKPGELVDHFLLLDSAYGISCTAAQQRILDWLASTRTSVQLKPG